MQVEIRWNGSGCLFTLSVVLKSLLTGENVPISRNDFCVPLAHPKLIFMSVGALMYAEI